MEQETQPWALTAPGSYCLLTLKTTQDKLDAAYHVTMDYDKLLVFVGQFGRFQKFIYFFGCLFYIGSCFDNMGYVFLSALPEHWCMIPGTVALNLTENQRNDLSFPMETVDEKTTHRWVPFSCGTYFAETCHWGAPISIHFESISHLCNSNKCITSGNLVYRRTVC